MQPKLLRLSDLSAAEQTEVIQRGYTSRIIARQGDSIEVEFVYPLNIAPFVLIDNFEYYPWGSCAEGAD